MPRTLDAVVLDMGGVLMPEPSGYAGAARRPDLIAWLRERGVEKPVDRVEEWAERARQAYRELAESCGQPDFERVFAELEPVVRRRLLAEFRLEATRRVYPTSARVVKRLARSLRLGLVSNTVFPGDHHARSLRRAGILGCFECAVWSANFGRRKPDPAMLEHVLAELGVSRHRAVFVGDKLSTDVLAARRAGVRSVWLRLPGARPPGPDDPRPDRVIRSIGELPGLLARL